MEFSGIFHFGEQAEEGYVAGCGVLDIVGICVVGEVTVGKYDVCHRAETLVQGDSRVEDADVDVVAGNADADHADED